VVSSVIAWSIWGLSITLGIVLVAAAVIGDVSGYNIVTGTIFQLSFSTVGVLIAVCRPRNPIGWLFGWMGLVFALSFGARLWSDAALVHHPGDLPGAAYAVWIQNWSLSAALTPIILILLLFPDGHPVTRRWRAVVALATLGIVLLLLEEGFAQARLKETDYPNMPNPLAVDGLARVAQPAELLAAVLLGGTLLVGIVSVVLRFRRSKSIERQQLKWLAWSSVALPATVGLLIVVDLPPVAGHPTMVALVKSGIVFTLTLIPISTGIAILRHRLYDIDRLIRRTLVYTFVSAGVVSSYLVLVVSLGAVFRLIAGHPSGLVTATSTLGAVVMARPLRSRVQSVVDRRFYRSRYDAERMLEQFSSRMQNQVDLVTLGAVIETVVIQTVQPEHVSLWLRSDDHHGSPERRGAHV